MFPESTPSHRASGKVARLCRFTPGAWSDSARRSDESGAWSSKSSFHDRVATPKRCKLDLSELILVATGLSLRQGLRQHQCASRQGHQQCSALPMCIEAGHFRKISFASVLPRSLAKAPDFGQGALQLQICRSMPHVADLAICFVRGACLLVTRTPSVERGLALVGLYTRFQMVTLPSVALDRALSRRPKSFWSDEFVIPCHSTRLCCRHLRDPTAATRPFMRGGGAPKTDWMFGAVQCCLPIVAAILGTSRRTLSAYARGNWRLHRSRLGAFRNVCGNQVPWNRPLGGADCPIRGGRDPLPRVPRHNFRDRRFCLQRTPASAKKVPKIPAPEGTLEVLRRQP